MCLTKRQAVQDTSILLEYTVVLGLTVKMVKKTAQAGHKIH